MQDMRPAPADVLEAVLDNRPSARCAHISMCCSSASGAQILRGDMVLLDQTWGGSAAEVWFHVQTDDRLIHKIYT